MTIHAELSTGEPIKAPPPWQPLPYEVPKAIETAARCYLAFERTANLTYSTLRLMDREGMSYTEVFLYWLECERYLTQARYELAEVLGSKPGTWPVDGWLIRNLTRRSGGTRLVIEPGSCPWPRDRNENP